MSTICFYHDDLDGYCSAAIVYNYHDHQIALQKINHGEIEFLNKIKNYDVIFVDFTPPTEYMIKLANNNRSMVILDHHKTAQDGLKCANSFYNVDMVLDVNHAGCVVTWNYFYPNSEMPMVVKLVEDYDIWKWVYPETENFVNGMDLNIWKFKPNSNNWKQILESDKSSELLNRILQDGAIITEYKEVYNYQLLEALSYEAMFNGYKILVINAPKNSSKVFSDKINNYPFVATYSHKQDQYIVSLYSVTGFDTTIISTQMVDKNGHRGGGHAGASGFKCETLPWIPIKED